MHINKTKTCILVKKKTICAANKRQECQKTDLKIMKLLCKGDQQIQMKVVKKEEFRS